MIEKEYNEYAIKDICKKIKDDIKPGDIDNAKEVIYKHNS